MKDRLGYNGRILSVDLTSRSITVQEPDEKFWRIYGGGGLAMHVKGLQMVPFEPRSQTNLALGYAVAPNGPRYDICEHDWNLIQMWAGNIRWTFPERWESSIASR